MHPNPFLHKLGFSPADRVVILHADDIGMCHSSLVAYQELIDFGLLSSAATMMPCPWFPATAAWLRAQGADPGIDMGVHLTLTSEWDVLRWGPVSTRDPAAGLLDAEGYFPRRDVAGLPDAPLDVVERELRTQIERTLAAGLDITHIDSHMFVLGHPRLLPLYIKLALAYRVPAFLLSPDNVPAHRTFYDDTVDVVHDLLREATGAGLPVFDHVHVMSLRDPSDRLGEMKRTLAGLPAGLSNIILHPAIDTPELRAIAPDWRCRVADYELFTDEALRAALREAGVQVIGFRALREAVLRPKIWTSE